MKLCAENDYNEKGGVIVYTIFWVVLGMFTYTKCGWWGIFSVIVGIYMSEFM